MKILLSFAISLIICFGMARGQTTKTVGSGGNYGTLKAAFDAINAGTITGTITLQITSSTTETATAALNASGTGNANYTTVAIYPTGTGDSIKGNFGATLIDLNGADNVTIDGRVNATGSTPDLTITNANTATFASAIRFFNSAESNVVKYCRMYSSCFSAGVGAVYFTSSTVGNGNDNNIIEYCNISNAGGRPVNALFTSGSSGRENSGNIIRNNNFYDFFNATSNSYGINMSNNSTGWTISGNSFYETTTFAPAGGYKYYPIFINTGLHTISNNYIGGSAPICSGSKFTVTSNYAHYFCGIFINGGTSTASSVENNTISNIRYTSTQANPWDGIMINSGNVNVTGNTIGATTDTSSIVVTTPAASASATTMGGVVTGLTINGGGSGYTTAPAVTFSLSGSTTPAVATATISGGVVTALNLISGGAGYTSTPTVNFDGASYSTSHGMIQNSAGTVNISGNNTGSITTVGSDRYSHGFESIYVRNITGTTTISNNLYGSLTTPKSLQTGSTAANSLQKQDIYGIYSFGLGNTTISGNTVANLHNAYSGVNSGTRTRGIQTIAGSNTIQNNVVRNITTASGQTTNKSGASVIGISQTSATAGLTQTVSGNTVYNLSNTHTTARVDVYGIYISGPASGPNMVSSNFVHSLSIASSNTSSDIEGIMLYNGLTTCANNIVNLGTTIATGYVIGGIWDESGATNNNSIYFNTVYIGGSVTSGTTSLTAALRNIANTSTRNYRNNILFNARSGGSTGKHYAIAIAGTSGLTIDYNDYYVTGTNGMLGSIASVDKSTLDLWKTGTGQDLHSLNTNPGFTVAGGTSAFNYYTSASLPAVAATGITTDYAGLTRGANPQMGALENNDYVWVGNISNDFATAANWEHGVVPPDGSDISFAASPARDCYLDQARSLHNITNAQSTYKLFTNGKQLTIAGNLVFTNGAQIDATAISSVVVFAGSAAQSIPAGLFVSNTLDGLTLNNTLGLTINNDITVVQPLTLTNGSLAIGAHTLTLNGVISVTSGTLNGGASANILIGGSGTASLPAVSLNNLTINRSSGVNLAGSVSVSGTLALTSGTLTLGANTLTISGSSPTSGGGTIDAGNAAANVVFANASAITLPATFFSGNVNNLTLSGAGGVTAGSNFTVNGVLNLAAANPPSGTRGLLEMTISYANYPGTTINNYLNSYILNMGSSATTIGTGDVTGTVKRATIVANTPYTFGHQYTTISLTTGTMPTELAVTITIGTTPGNTTPSNDKIRDAIKRTYEIVPTGGSGSYVTANFHYLDNELTSSNSPYHVNSELKLTTMDYDIDAGGHGAPYSDEHGRANYDYTNKYIGLSSVPISYLIQIPTTHEWRTIFTLRDYGVAYYTWTGSQGTTDWSDANNWTLSGGGSGVPSSLGHVIIPNVASTNNKAPVLPSGTTTINTLSIENGGVLTMGSNTLRIENTFSGGWEDQNPNGNDPGSSIVIFAHPSATHSYFPHTTISGNARFNKVRIADSADVTNQAGSIIIIQDSIRKTGNGTGKWYADIFDATVAYNGGNQTVMLPDGSPNYHNLILSGSGIKTLPALSLTGNLSTSGTATASAAAALAIGGNVTIGEGSAFSTGAFDHSIGGNFENLGTFTPSAGYAITMNGTSAQSVLGTVTTNFDKLTINNTNGVTLYTNENVNNVLALASGNLTVSGTTLGINGTISKTSGFIDASAMDATVIFGGSSAQSIPSEAFYNNDVYNLTVNNANNVQLNGTLNLLNTLAATSGRLDAFTNSPTLVYAGTSAQTIGSNLYLNNTLNNLTIDNTAGVTLSNDALTTVSGTLAINPGKKFEIAPGKQLTVSGTLTNNAGTSGLVIKSTAVSGSGTGSLITGNSVSGTVERFIPNDVKWHFLSSPVAAQPVWPEFAPTPSGDPLTFGVSPWGWDFYYWNPNASTSNQLYWVNLRQDDAGTYNNWPADQSGNSAGYGDAIPNFTVGRGYLTAYNAGWNPATGSPETHQFAGALNSTSVTRAIVPGVNAWNLAGNPYPSSIDWQATSGWTRTNLVEHGTSSYDMWIYNPTVGNYGVINSLPSSEGTNSVSRYIAPMQAFFVNAASNGNLVMTSAAQVHSTQTWLKEGVDSDNSLRLKLTTTANSFSDEMIVNVNSTNDNGGSMKFWSMSTEAPELFSIKGGSNYSIDRLPSVNENSVVTIGIKAGMVASYSLAVTGQDNFSWAKSIILEDLKTGATQDLKNNPSCTFSASPGDNPERFHLHFGGPFGISDQLSQTDFTIYSFNNSVHISNISGKSLIADVYICNILGQKIIYQRMTEQSTRIDLVAPSGWYIVTLITNGETLSQKIYIR